MPTKIRTQIGKTWVEFDANGPYEAINRIAEFSTVFCDSKCKLCGSSNINFTAFTTKDGYTMYPLKCADCGAERVLLTNKTDGAFYWKTKTQEGGEMPHSGWHVRPKYTPNANATQNAPNAQHGQRPQSTQPF